MISMSIPCTIGWICLLLPKPLEMESPALFYVGRLFTGKFNLTAFQTTKRELMFLANKL
jgi:hypothetical protein